MTPDASASSPASDKDIIDLNPDQVVHDHEPASPQAAKAKVNNRYNALLMGAALLVAAAAGGWIYKDYLSRYYPSDEMSALIQKVDALDAGSSTLREQLASVERLSTQLKTDVDALETQSAATATEVADGGKLQSSVAGRVDTVEQQLADTRAALETLSKRAATVPTAGTGGAAASIDLTPVLQRIENLEKDVASLKANPTDNSSNLTALSQSLAELKAKVAAGTPYSAEIDRISRMVPAAQGLDVLQQHAANGLPDARGLAAELKSLIPELPKPIVPGPVAESEGWWAGIYNSLSGLITIKVEGDVDWPSAASAAVALADSGDIPQAIEQLNVVEAAKPPALQQWLDRANARIAVEKALQDVDQAVLRVLAAKG